MFSLTDALAGRLQLVVDMPRHASTSVTDALSNLANALNGLAEALAREADDSTTDLEESMGEVDALMSMTDASAAAADPPVHDGHGDLGRVMGRTRLVLVRGGVSDPRAEEGSPAGG